MPREILRKFYLIAAWLFSKVVLIIPYKIAIALGGFLGILAYYIVSDSRNITKENLRKCLPEKTPREIENIARNVFINQGKNLFELFSFPKLTNSDIIELAELENSQAMKEAFALKKGVLIASAHCGNWEIMGAALSVGGFLVNVIAKRIYIEGLNSLLVGLRHSKGIQVILRSQKDSAKQMLRSLRNNEAIGMLIDQDTAVPGVFVDFFSRPAWTPSGLAVLALKTGATVMLALDTRLENDKHKCMLKGPIKMINTGNFDKDVFENTQMITKMIEDHIRKNPDQWVWMHRRWKTRPQS